MELLATGIILDMEGFTTIAEMDAYKAYEGAIRRWEQLKAGDAWLYESVVAAERMERNRLSAAAHGPETAPPMEKMQADTTMFIGTINACKTKEAITDLGTPANIDIHRALAKHAPALWRTMRRAVQAKMATFEVRS
jgi:hypothetical protein